MPNISSKLIAFIAVFSLIVVGGLLISYGNQGMGGTQKPGAKTLPVAEVKMSIPTIYPVDHASFVMEWDEVTTYVDPVGEAAAYSAFGAPDLIAITHSHGDHLDIPLLEILVTDSVSLIVTKEVFDKLPASIQAQSVVIANGENHQAGGLAFTAVPMYNTAPDKLQYHPKGVGNGYLIEKDGFRVYVAGDTEDIPEMRALTDIDIAFVPMNEPYTMSVAAAADAVLDFAPKQVYPYHYRGKEGFSDLAQFEALVSAGNPAINIVIGEWYKEAAMTDVIE
jgi:L-ascorbate metabolism protein UlaG (beta-lactamase superfamily)